MLLQPLWTRTLLLLFTVTTVFCELQVELTIANGKIKGTVGRSRDGRRYASFQGLRYAEKPERFQLAKPLQNWDGVRHADTPGDLCIQQMPGQMSLMGSRGTEDCLFINVYTPKPEKGANLPVMVWIYGGAFVFGGSTDYKADFFMDEDVVLVSFNYRLAAFGFLYNEDDVLPGNLAMKDQVMALKWVQQNIHYFGGDPNMVTIFGESAGSASVHYHVLSDMSKGLFHRAIMQSGSAISPWAFARNPKWTAKTFAEGLGCPSTDTKAMVKCLQAKPMEDIVDQQIETEWGPDMKYQWGPVAEKTADAKSAFITKPPAEMVEQKLVANKVPVIIGVNKNEGAAICSAMILENEELVQQLNGSWGEHAPEMFMYDVGRNVEVADVEGANRKLRHHYFRNLDVGLSTEQHLTDIYSDWFFNRGAQISAQSHSTVAPTYTYLYTYYGGFSLLHLLNYHNYEPPTHTDEFFYLFPYLMIPPPHTAEEIDFSKKLVRLWVSFARTGKPTAVWGAAQHWPELDLDRNGMTWYKLDKHTQILGDVFGCRLKFWDDLLANELKPIK